MVPFSFAGVPPSPDFPVTMDNLFIVRGPMRTSMASGSADYVALVFLDAQRKKVERLVALPHCLWKRLSMAAVERQTATGPCCFRLDDTLRCSQ